MVATNRARRIGSRPWVVIVGPFSYPWGQAASRRVHGIAQSIVETGRDVVVCSAGPPQPESDESVGSASGTFTHVALGEFPAGRSTVARGVQWLCMGAATLAWLTERSARTGSPSHVIVYGGGASYLARLRRWARSHDVAVLVDIVEWYDVRNMRGGALGPQALNEVIGRQLQRRSDGAIVISRLLENYYRTAAFPVVRVPPTLVPDAISLSAGRPAADGAITLIYAGTPARKDEIGTLVRAVRDVDAEGTRLRLELLGPDAAEVMRLSGIDSLPRSVTALGRIPQREVAGRVRAADYSVLLREEKRSSNAGFPTKFVESLGVGTPVVANLTGDLGDYLRDGVNGFVVAPLDERGVRLALDKVLATSIDERSAQRRAANEIAKTFDYRNYVAEIDRLLTTTARAVDL